jgi:hypothetical protein
MAPHLRERSLDALVERHPDVVAARKELEKVMGRRTMTMCGNDDGRNM